LSASAGSFKLQAAFEPLVKGKTDMPSDNRKLIAVLGATGQQGGGVVRAQRARGKFTDTGRKYDLAD